MTKLGNFMTSKNALTIKVKAFFNVLAVINYYFFVFKFNVF